MNVTSAPQEGTNFELRMPIWRGKTNAADEGGRVDSPQGFDNQADRANILIVEDGRRSGALLYGSRRVR